LNDAAAKKYDEAETLLTALEKEDAWDWRVLWYRGTMLLLRQQAAEALKLFDQVYFDLPGEVAPKLAVGLAAEMANNQDLAVHMYDLVSRTDSTMVSASFGLARCLRAKGDRKGAVSALDRVPQSSALYMRSRVEATRILVGLNGYSRAATTPAVADLEAASAVCESLTLEGASRHVLRQELLVSALDCLRAQGRRSIPGKILGAALAEKNVRAELERSFRALARMSSGEERIKLVENANQFRPRTLF